MSNAIDFQLWFFVRYYIKIDITNNNLYQPSTNLL